jgi:hypothetical protein
MKKVFLFFAVAMVFAACTPKAAKETATPVDSVAAVDTMAVDTAAVDTVAADSVK